MGAEDIDANARLADIDSPDRVDNADRHHSESGGRFGGEAFQFITSHIPVAVIVQTKEFAMHKVLLRTGIPGKCAVPATLVRGKEIRGGIADGAFNKINHDGCGGAHAVDGSRGVDCPA